MIHIAGGIWIDENAFEETFIRSAGPGGQNVNKGATAVQLRFDARGSTLPEGVKARLERLAGSRLTTDGVIVLTARSHRTQERNRQDAQDRMVALIRAAVAPPAPRIPTRASYGERRRRREDKARRSSVKGLRGRPDQSD